MEYFKESYATVSINKELNAVVVVWNGFANEEQYKKTILTALKVMVENGCINWISDMRGSKAVSPKMKDWVRVEILPKAMKAGGKKMAVMLSKDIFHKMYAELVLNLIESNGVEVKYFDKMEKIEAWLKV